MEINENSTIEEAKQFLKENWEKGTDCPACTQRVHLAPFKLEYGMTRGLIELYKLDSAQRGSYHHVKDIESWRTVYGGGKFAKCKFWGFIVQMENDDSKKRTSGMWAITDKGRNFVEGKITVPSHIRLFNMKSYGFFGEPINIQQSLGNFFDYSELMGNFLPTEPVQGTLLDVPEAPKERNYHR